jgi:predicted RNA-binding protein with PUA-like domain
LAFFLLKTEPSVYSFADLTREGETVWDGVTNNLALKNIRLMRTGDSCFIYHSGDERAVIGIARVVKSAYPDPKKRDEKSAVVKLEAVSALKRPVSLSEMKRRSELRSFDLIRLPRLSVIAVPKKIWDLILELSKGE